MAVTTLVLYTAGCYSRLNHIIPQTRPADPDERARPVTSTPSKSLATCTASRWGQTLSDKVLHLVDSAWTDGSKAQYWSYINRWILFCEQHNHNPNVADITLGTEFLASLFDTGVGYSVINTARSALSNYLNQIDGFDFGKHPVVCKVLRGVFKLKPSLPRYVVTYDPDIVMKYLSNLPPWETIPLKGLTLKFVTLLAFISSHRCQTLNSLSVDHLDIKLAPVDHDYNPCENQAICYIPSLIKNSTPSFHASPIKLVSFPNMALCPVKGLSVYVQRTAPLRKSRKLIMSYHNFTEVSTATVRSYVTDILAAAGINSKGFQFPL